MRASHLCSLKPLPGWLATVGAGENGGGGGGVWKWGRKDAF